MTPFQITGFTLGAAWLLWWASTHDEARAKRIARTGQLLLWGATLAMIAIMWQSPYVIFANDGTLGGIVSDKVWPLSSAMGKVTVLALVAGVLIGAVVHLAVAVFNQNKINDRK
jgi:hypothetical protein